MAAIPSPIDVASWIVAVLFVAVLAAAAISDVRTRRIPNWSVIAILALFAVWAFVGPQVSLKSSFGAAGIILLTTVALWTFNLLGAGDAKLMTAVALFAGLGHLVAFVLVTVLAGGTLAIASLVMHPRRTLAMIQTGGKDNSERGIPYGVAIAVAGALTIAGICLGMRSR